MVWICVTMVGNYFFVVDILKLLSLNYDEYDRIYYFDSRALEKELKEHLNQQELKDTVVQHLH